MHTVLAWVLISAATGHMNPRYIYIDYNDCVRAASIIQLQTKPSVVYHCEQRPMKVKPLPLDPDYQPRPTVTYRNLP